jgi:hypothetical protein
LKKIISIVVIAILVLTAFSVLSAPKVKAQTSEVQILSYSWYAAPTDTTLSEYAGDLVAVGEVQNVGNNTLSEVLVDGFATNSSGTLVDSAEASIYALDLSPGQKAPFYLDFTPENSLTGDQSWVPTINNVTVRLSYIGTTNQTVYSGLTIPAASTSAIISGGAYTVTGIVQNTGTQTTGNVWVVATFYNASGTAIALNYTNYLTSSLSPGSTVPFTVTPIDNTATLSSEISNYSLEVQYAPLTSSTSPSPNSTPNPNSTPSTSTSTIPTATPSPGVMSTAVTFAIAGVIVVVILVVLIVFLFLRKRQKNPQFEPPPPPPPPPPPT